VKLVPLVILTAVVLSACAQSQPVSSSVPAPPSAASSTVTAVLPEATSSSSIPKTETPEIQAEPIVPVEHIIDENPSALDITDTQLTLEGYGAVGALADQNLSIADMLMYAVQDEFLARGEYLAIIEKFGSQTPYANIVRSEETHLDFLREVYQSYNIQFPNDTSGDHIIIPETLLQAAKTGVQAEIDNIAMYEKFLTYDLPQNVFDVFTALKNGSDSHLLAFQKQVDKLS
jgi:hypothetical protein